VEFILDSGQLLWVQHQLVSGRIDLSYTSKYVFNLLANFFAKFSGTIFLYL
jgi:hypothetical protein